MRLPIPPKSDAVTANYWCTWSSQSRFRAAATHVEAPAQPGSLTMQMRAMLTEDFLFGKLGLLAKYFDGVRSDLIVVLDDGWDVPPVDPSVPPHSDPFGSMVLFAEHFPSFAVPGDPAESLKRLNHKIQSLGYKGLGLWVAPQIPRRKPGESFTMADAAAHWTERAKWSARAGVKLWKVDWGYHCGSVEYRAMMTRLAKQYAPGLLVEHSLCQPPTSIPLEQRAGNEQQKGRLDYIRAVLPHCDVFRTYDVVAAFSNALTIDRVAEVFAQRTHVADRTIAGIINIEDEMYIGAALGCSLGVMKHEAFRTLDADKPAQTECAWDSVIRAIRWQRIAPPFSVHTSENHASGEYLTDREEFHQTSWPNLQGVHAASAPAALSRNCPLPRVTSAGEKPFVLASRHPDGAFAIGTMPRTAPGRQSFTPPASVEADEVSADASIGVFGRFASLTLRFNRPIEGKRFYMQDLLSDEADEITHEVKVNGHVLTIPGEIITRIGLSAKTLPCDSSEPGARLIVK